VTSRCEDPRTFLWRLAWIRNSTLIAPCGARDFTVKTPCLRGEITMFARGKHHGWPWKTPCLRGLFAQTRIYGFLKDLVEFHHKFPHLSFLRSRELPCNCHVLKDLDNLVRAPPRIYGFLKDLVVLNYVP
jgi:hypothetical protein